MIDGRLRWHCRRSCLEIDLLLNNFLDKPDGYAGANERQKQAFNELLKQPDEELLKWLLGKEQPEDAALRDVVECIRRTDQS